MPQFLPILVSMLLLLVGASHSFAADDTRKPNIVVILADDLGYADLGVYGSTFYETPNLDRLAAQGMRFTDAYAACPVCSPTRASLMTGQYPARVGLTNFLAGTTQGKLIPADFVRQLPLDTPNLARLLNESGYATWHVGKWHLGDRAYGPDKQGFDVSIAAYNKAPGKRGNFSPWNLENLEDGPEGKFQTDGLVDAAIELIARNENKPFFLNLWTYAPHVPIDSPPDLIEKYEAKAKAMGLNDKEALRKDEPFPIENKRNQRITRRLVQSDPVYAGMIENLDMNIGRLLQAIEDAGQADNTIVLFTSDNGGLATAEGSPTHNGPLRDGKGWMYEGGIRVPLIVRWPGVVEAGSVSREPVTTPDYLPTFLAAAEVEAPGDAPIDGVNLAPALKGAALDREAIYWHYPHYGNQGGSPAAAVRAGEWKLIRHYEKDKPELYNLRTDVGESTNVAAEHPDIVKKLSEMLGTWLKDVDAKFPTPNPDFAAR